MSLLDWALENVSEWESDSVLIMTGHGRDFCHPGRVLPGVEFVTRQQWKSAQQTAWNGEGLPPVGCECEVTAEDFEGWHLLKVLAVHNGELAGVITTENSLLTDRLEKFSAGYNAAKFRPIRTEAERKREEAIAAIWNSSGIRARDGGKQAAFDIYDAIASGKIPHITLK